MSRIVAIGVSAVLALSWVARGEVIGTDALETMVPPGGSGSFRMLLSDSQTPVSGYTLDIEFIARSGVSGSVTADVGSSNFFDSQNLFTAGGESRDPSFSSITASPGGGIVITTISGSGNGVTALIDVNDVLAEVFVTASPDALGIFDVVLSGGTALSDESGDPILYGTSLGWINVPAPGIPVLALGFLLHWGPLRAQRPRQVQIISGAQQ